VATIPAICNKCGLVPSLFAISGSGNIVSGNISPCPKCGAPARTIDGIYDTLEDTLRILVTSEAQAAQLQSLIDILSKAKTEGTSGEKIEQAIKETAPAFSSLAKLFSEQKNRLELWTIIGLVIAWLTYVQTHPNSPPTQNTTINIVNSCMAPAPAKPNRHERRASKSRARHK
jgi:hypothetical protein